MKWSVVLDLSEASIIGAEEEGVNRIVTVAFSGFNRCTCKLDMFRLCVCAASSPLQDGTRYIEIAQPNQMLPKAREGGQTMCPCVL